MRRVEFAEIIHESHGLVVEEGKKQTNAPVLPLTTVLCFFRRFRASRGPASAAGELLHLERDSRIFPARGLQKAAPKRQKGKQTAALPPVPA